MAGGNAETLVDLAEETRAHGDLAGAGDASPRAVAFHEEKGNVLPAERCREQLATLTASAFAAAKS